MRGGLMSGKSAGQRAVELAAVLRVADEVGHPQMHGADDVRRRGAGGNDDDLEMPPYAPAHPLHQRQPVEMGQGQLHRHDADAAVRLQRVERRVGIVGYMDAMAVPFEGVVHADAQRAVRAGDQNGCRRDVKAGAGRDRTHRPRQGSLQLDPHRSPSPLGAWIAVLKDYHAKQTIMDAIMVQNRAIKNPIEIPQNFKGLGEIA